MEAKRGSTRERSGTQTENQWRPGQASAQALDPSVVVEKTYSVVQQRESRRTEERKKFKKKI